MENLRSKIHETADYLRAHGVDSPEVGVILGSGLNDYADRIQDPVVISYADIPNFHSGNVEGHRGTLIYGKHKGRNVILLAGRFHYYESKDMDVTAFPARVLVELGVERFIITNAAGCINTQWHKGQLMLIRDHINLSGSNPLMGENLDEYGKRFPDMTFAYSKDLRNKLRARATIEGIDLVEGVYAMFSGPTFETPAEIMMARIIGADAAGMSTVPEAIIACHAEKEVIGITFLSNMAAGIQNKKLDGSEVTEEGVKIRDVFGRVVDMAIEI